jgi:HD-GYP domain-containing protein (c-di-GMP phosphodiesterase class II)
MSLEKTNVNRSDAELLGILFSYVPKIAEAKQLDSLLVLIADLGRELVLAERCSLWLVSSDKKELWTKVAHGCDEIRIPITAGFVGYSYANNEPLLIEDAYNDSRFDSSVDKNSGYRTKAVLTVPFKNSVGEVMGVFQAINKVGGTQFSKDDLKFLQLTAVYSAKSLESAMLFQELERTQEEITLILGAAAECRSVETGNHVKRVAEMCYTLSKYAGLSEGMAQKIRLASSMHDLGKIGIPDEILNKNGKFLPEEYAVMKNHSRLGYEMLSHSKCELLRLAAEIAFSHHERIDGKGYPLGLSGNEIPLAGRICAVADVFDALINVRCYKRPWSREQVIALYQEERGRQFEARLVDILLEHLDEFYAINDSMPD